MPTILFRWPISSTPSSARSRNR